MTTFDFLGIDTAMYENQIKQPVNKYYPLFLTSVLTVFILWIFIPAKKKQDGWLGFLQIFILFLFYFIGNIILNELISVDLSYLMIFGVLCINLITFVVLYKIASNYTLPIIIICIIIGFFIGYYIEEIYKNKEIDANRNTDIIYRNIFLLLIVPLIGSIGVSVLMSIQKLFPSLKKSEGRGLDIASRTL